VCADIKAQIERLAKIQAEIAKVKARFGAEDLRAMEAACSTNDLRDIVRHGTIRSPSGAGTRGQITKVSSNPGIPGSNTGWRTAAPIGPPPGVNWADRLMDAQDAKDRHELMMQEARRQAMLKVAEPKA
jgi:hypothetical protein